MNLYSAFILKILLLISVATAAQQERLTLPLPEVQNREATVTTTNNAGGKPGFEIIDNTGDSLITGYLPKSGTNNRIALITPVNKQEWLTALIENSMPQNTATSGNKVLCVINDLSAGSTNSGIYIRIKASVYQSAGTIESYTPVNNVDTCITSNNTNINDINGLIANTLSSIMTLPGGIIKTSVNKRLTREQVLKKEQQKYAFISDEIFPTGIYMAFEDFKVKKPVYNQFFIKTDKATNTVEVNGFTITDSTLRPVTPWAIAVNNELYLYRNKKLYPLENAGGNLVFSKYIDPEKRKNNGMFWRKTIGKQLAEKYNNPFDNVYEIKITNYRNKGVVGAIKVNADTGALEL